VIGRDECSAIDGPKIGSDVDQDKIGIAQSCGLLHDAIEGSRDTKGVGRIRLVVVKALAPSLGQAVLEEA
jgi:hypothetical protein